MAEFNQKESGLIVPVEKPPHAVPLPRYGPIEIQDASDRQKASEALKQLWYAAGLHRRGGIPLPGSECRDIRYTAWELLAKILLGDEAPYGEELT